MLDDGIVASAAEIDPGMITGAGWPFWLSGITPTSTGQAESVTGQRLALPGVMAPTDQRTYVAATK